MKLMGEPEVAFVALVTEKPVTTDAGGGVGGGVCGGVCGGVGAVVGVHDAPAQLAGAEPPPHPFVFNKQKKIAKQ